jgi:cobalamin synthase
MTRDGTLSASGQDNGQQKGSAMKNWRYIGLHAVAAAAFIFLLQRYALSATLESSLLWAVTFGGCAAGLAYAQSNR